MEYKNVAIDKLKVLDKNPRKITEKELKKLEASIQSDTEFLNVRPILVNVINDQYMVYGGAQRLQACRNLGMKTVPCAIEYQLDQKTMDYRLLADNSHAGEWDFAQVDASVFKEDSLKEMGLFGKIEDEMRQYTENETKVNLDPIEGEKKPKAQRTGTHAIGLSFTTETQFEAMTAFMSHLQQTYKDVETLGEKFLLFLLDWKQSSLAEHE